MHQHFSDKTVHRPDWPVVLRQATVVAIVVAVLLFC